MQRKTKSLQKKIKNRWSNLKYKVEEMSKEEIKNEKPN